MAFQSMLFFLGLHEWSIKKAHTFISHSGVTHKWPWLCWFLQNIWKDNYLKKKKGKGPTFLPIMWAVNLSSYVFHCWVIQCDIYYYTFSVVTEYFSGSLDQNPTELKICTSAMSFWHWESPNKEINVTCRMQLCYN